MTLAAARKASTSFLLESDPSELYNALLREGVIVRPVAGYGLKTHLRVTIGDTDENVKFITALRKVLER